MFTKWSLNGKNYMRKSGTHGVELVWHRQSKVEGKATLQTWKTWSKRTVRSKKNDVEVFKASKGCDTAGTRT